jgi:glutamate dehydrogenase (NADP+)
MSQNASRLSWGEAHLDDQLKGIMQEIHGRCVEYGGNADNSVNYIRGANIAGFVKVADAMMAYGII